MRTNLSVLLACAAMLGACANDTGPATTTLTMGFSGLEALGPDYVYEGWLIVDGAPVTAGRFEVDADGNATPDSFEVDEIMAADATAYVLTIEPAVGDEPGPSSVHILGGDITGGNIDLSTAHPAALGTDFSTATGAFILETPTSGSVADDYAQGIWWLIPGSAGMAPGLDLPELPAGWTYEGWVVGPDGPVSTGTFNSGEGADSDGAGPDAGPDGSPPFPGQDFVDPAQVLTSGYMAVISVEPVPDNSPAPFLIKPLANTGLEDVMAPATQSMTNISSDTVPAGSITLGLQE